MRLFVFLLAIVFAVAARAAPTTYDLQTEDSQVGFSWFLGTDEITGEMPVSRAEISIDFQRLEQSQVNVAVDVTRARAGFPFASEGMKSRRVLWADKFPEITFSSRSVSRDGTGAQIAGDLTVRGVTRPVVFAARLFRPKGTELGDRRQLTIVLTSSISRKAFGADGWSDLAGDEVKLAIRASIRAAE